MIQLDHLSVVAPSLVEGVAHVRGCLGLDVPFGQRHLTMGTHNHLIQLGGSVYLEIIALDPSGAQPPHRRWFGLDDGAQVRADWDAGRRLKGWVARTDAIDAVLAGRESTFGRKVALPHDTPAFDFAIPHDGSLPLGGAAPSIIDRRGQPRSMATIADLGARLVSFTLEYPDSARIDALHRELGAIGAPVVRAGARSRYIARIETAGGIRELT
ncbi:MAG: VOC family protein [Phreatobacter sp.]|uniref:VOC family protein n=1 Tax=Phreatobacter sp. TaxID=1966341 RepID=UPI001A556124|nr:VOC family protein [Phreatobacter sp.]MBL8570642.1 VOC family protein [Phreatobacter sp.]